MERTWKILVVDDTPQNVKLLDAILSSTLYNFEVRWGHRQRSL